MIDPRLSQQLLRAVDTRFDQLSRQRPYTAYGTVATVDTVNRKASVYVSGDAVPSAGFAYPVRMDHPAVGNRVRVVIDPRGDRFIEDVLDAHGAYPKKTGDVITGILSSVGAAAGFFPKAAADGTMTADAGGSNYPVGISIYNVAGTNTTGWPVGFGWAFTIRLSESHTFQIFMDHRVSGGGRFWTRLWNNVNDSGWSAFNDFT